MKRKGVTLTEAMIAAATCPSDRDWIPIWDAKQPNFLARIYRTGGKSYWCWYRPPGAGRRVNPKWVKIGNVDAISLKKARDAAKAQLGAVATGGDPARERREGKRKEQARLEPAINRYEKALESRKVVKRKEIVSLLRREMLKPFGNVDMANLTRPVLVDRINAVNDSGRPGTAKDLRNKGGVFMGWATNEGLINFNPLAGYRLPRQTRAQRIEKPGRALADWELAGFWRGVASQGWPFGPYLQLLLLLGQRRTETALMQWPDLVLDEGVAIYPDLPPQKNLWIVPPKITKSGRPHYIPLPSQVVAILNTMPKLAKSNAVFPGRKGKSMTGWSKRLPDAYAATSKEGVGKWTPHDLRRTARTGLGKLGVDAVVAEMLIDHAISDELKRTYDRGDYWLKRVGALQRWADHVFAQITKRPQPRLAVVS